VDAGDLVARGQALAQSNACLACHSIDGSPLVGPTWKGVYGTEETLTDGTKVTVTDEYIRESIKDPNAKIVQNFLPNLMPQTFGQALSDSDIEAIIAYIKTLR
jgi:cytochrome c oxidase subunit 2